MKKNSYAKAALAEVMLELSPQIIRNSLLEDPDFREEYGLTPDVVLSFDDSGISVKRSHLFNAIRNLYSDKRESKINDTDGRKWKLTKTGHDEKVPNFQLRRGRQCFLLPDFSALSPDKLTRLSSLEERAQKINLPEATVIDWHALLSERSLSDDEFDALQREFSDTPIEKTQLIRDEINKGQSRISSVIPNSRRYFERLVGEYDGSVSVDDYASKSGRLLFQGLSEWDPYEGFLYSLLMGSHLSLTAQIDVDSLSKNELLRAYDFLENRGDRISQVGAIEVGLRVLSTKPEIEASLLKLIEQIRDDDVEDKDSDIKLLSSLFVLVDGELARIQLLADAPPFYRRLAALAQATLIHRQLVASHVDIGPFSEWAMSRGWQLFYLRTLADLRHEPRWNSTLASASQLKAEFLGRIIIAGQNNESTIRGRRLAEIIFGTGPDSLHAFYQNPAPFFPGPLEGGDEARVSLPTEIFESINKDLESAEVTPTSFIALVNASMVFHVKKDQAELAAKAIKLAYYRLLNVEDRLTLVGTLNGLAYVSAVTRSHELAEQLRILLRRYRQDAEYSLSIEEAIWAGLLAAGSHAELKNWTVYVGDWLTELAFGALKKNEGQVLHSHLKWLCHLVPELWVTCGRAEAALSAFHY